MSINVQGLRPWEWDAMDTHDYYRIVTIQHIWRDHMGEARRMATEAQQARAAAQRG